MAIHPGRKPLQPLGTEITRLRKAMGLSQADFARLFGVHVMTVSKWERDVTPPSAYQLALMDTFRAAVAKKHDLVRQQIETVLVGAGVIAALYFLLKAAKE